MAPIFSNNSKNLKNSVPNGTGIFVTEKQYLQWKPHLNRIKWRRVTEIKEIQISRNMTIYGQT